MNTIAISTFKATCLAVLESVRKRGEPIVVTRWGKPVAQIQPPPPPEPKRESQFGCMQDSLEILGDLVEPLPDLGWNVLK